MFVKNIRQRLVAMHRLSAVDKIWQNFLCAIIYKGDVKLNRTDEKNSKADNANSIAKVPIINIRMMTDDEWNRLAYQNYLKRRNEVQYE